MSTTLEQKAHSALQQYSLFRQGGRIAVGVSGGADSVALLRFLAQVSGQFGWRLTVCHVHHGLRGTEADRDEQFVRWLFRYDGLLSLSQAYRDGDRILIISGPMKDVEGRIRRVDKRGCSGQVLLSFNGREIPTWLSFELIDRID